MRFASIGSGSRGNGTLVQDEQTSLLIDLGFTIRETEKRLARMGVDPGQISAILVTHEHSDHLNGVGPFSRKYKVPVYMTPGTYVPDRMGVLPDLQLINCHQPFRIDDLEIIPVPVPHDAREPCQYLVSNHSHKLGILTDLGHITAHVLEQYSLCHGLLIESNHDPEMLAQGSYPYPLKVRVGGDHGHLSNQQAANLLEQIDLSLLEHLVIAHVSEKNNCLSKIETSIAGALGNWSGIFTIADQDNGFDWITLG
jgi:phosphoribosyl 1,2-cyclic phosphodiesterase